MSDYSSYDRVETVEPPERCYCGAPVKVIGERPDAEVIRPDGAWVVVVTILWRCDNGHEGPVLYAGSADTTIPATAGTSPIAECPCSGGDACVC